MRTIVMFDLPNETSLDRKRYRDFRKFLIKEGFFMMQESIYTKICLNLHAVEKVKSNIKKHRPPHGIIQLLTVTERQFAGMTLITGENISNYIDNDNRMIIL